MWWKIARKEFMLNIISARFIIALVLCLLLIPVTLIISLSDYNKRVETYQIERDKADKAFSDALVYSAVRPTIVIPPKPLSILCQGITNQVAHTVKIRIDEIPLLAEGSANSSDNPLLMSFFYFDFVHVLAILISLLALVFSYDLFSGEKENGTLRLIYSNSVKQSSVITGKISGVFLTLMPALVLCYLISIASLAVFARRQFFKERLVWNFYHVSGLLHLYGIVCRTGHPGFHKKQYLL